MAKRFSVLRKQSCLKLIAGFIFFVFSATWVHADGKILILNSYSSNLPWTKRISEEIEADITSRFPDVTVDVEYMDVKKYDATERYMDLLYQLFDYKYSSKKYDLIFTVDDAAVEFASRFHEKLFMNSPIVFLGVNNLDIEEEVDRNYITGILEIEDQRKQIETILKVKPNTEKIYLIYDRTLSGNYRYAGLQKIITEFPHIEFERIDNTIPFDNILEILSFKQSNAAAIIGSMYIDNEGKPLDLSETIRSISKVSKIPVFATHDQVAAYGTIGGTMFSVSQHARSAVYLGMRILNGETPADVDIIASPISETKFNAEELDRFGISTSQLPEDAHLFNYNPSFFETYRKLIIVFSLVVSALVGVIIFLSKILTERKQAQQMFEVLFNAIEIGICQMGRDRVVHLSNQKALELFEGNLIQNKKSHVKDLGLIFEDENHEVIPFDKLPSSRAFEKGETVRDELIRVTRKDTQETRWFLIGAYPQNVTENGECNNAFVTFRDVTAERETEKQLRRAEKLDSMGKIVAGIAHDFNNGLGIVLNSLELMRMSDSLNDDQKELLSNCVVATDRCIKLTSRLLSFSRGDPNNRSRQLVDVAHFMEDFVDFLPYSFTPEIEFCFHNVTEFSPVMVNASDLENALLNLCINARDAMNGRGKITISTRQIPSSNGGSGFVEISIADNGPGIPEAIREKIFDPFFSTKGADEGTGLGLSIVYGFVNRSDGKISMNSTVGEGTEFVIRLPLADVPRQNTQVAKRTVVEKGKAQSILVVDDELTLVETTAQMLEGLGYAP